MRRKAIKPSTVHPPFAEYSHAVLIQNHTFQLLISGQLGVTLSGAIPDNLEEQAVLCFTAIEEILNSAGMTRDNTVKITTYLTHSDYLKPYMSIRDQWVKEINPRPASTLLIISGFSRPEFKIEIEATAVK